MDVCVGFNAFVRLSVVSVKKKKPGLGSFLLLSLSCYIRGLFFFSFPYIFITYLLSIFFFLPLAHLLISVIFFFLFFASHMPELDQMS